MEATRAYSFLTVKKVDEETRTISGIASSVSVDRAGDVVEPLGAKVKLPIPLLLDHNHLSAVGEVEWAKPNAKGIPFRAHIKKIDEPGPVQELCDMAWSLVKSGLRKALSIGFRPIDFEPLGNGGTRFKAWEWFELSLVTVPCNAECTISEIKLLDRAAMLAASRHAPIEPPKGPAIRVTRDEGGFNFIVESLDKDGTPDWRTQSEHLDYDKALREAKSRAHQHRIPVVDATGVEPRELGPPKEAQKAAPKAKAAITKIGKPLSETQPICTQFKLPDVNARIEALDHELISERALAIFDHHRHSMNEANCLSASTQVMTAYTHMCSMQASLYAFLEAAFKRIDALEAEPALAYAGVHQRALGYRRGQAVTHKGNLYIAISATEPGDMPGESGSWQLAVRAGRDGKDAGR